MLGSEAGPITSLTRQPISSEALVRPTNLAIAPNWDIYVGDGYGSSFINQYNARGKFIRTFGGKGRM